VEESSAEDLESDLLGEGSERTRKNVESSEKEEMVEGSAVQTVVEPYGRSGSARRTTVLRSSTSTLSQYTSSSSSDEARAGPLPRPEPRRRKLRPRPVSSAERRARQKSAQIEAALLEGDKDRLGRLAVSEGGLLSDEVRARVWPRLVGISHLEDETSMAEEEELPNHSEYNQVVLDVNRSLKRFPPGIAESARPGLQDQLTRLIVRVLLAQPSLHYYQGYHDVAITFLLVVGERLGYQIMSRLSCSHLSQFMQPSMEQTMSLLQLMYPLLRQANPALHSHLVRAELGTVFALPWLITWFGHVLPNYKDVVRLYDFFLAGPPLMPVYLATAIVIHRQEEILATECEMSAVHGLLSRIPVNLPFEALLLSCQQLYESHPPFSLEREAEADLARGKGRGAGRGEGASSFLVRLVIYSAPVLVGVVIWRFLQSST